MNNELTESENALNCIIENYINELQRNTCDDDEEDMRIYQEKMEYIKNLKEIVLKDLEELEYQKRKNTDLLETLNCIKKHAMIKKTKGFGVGAEVIVSFHSSDDDFEKVGWVFGIVK